MLTGNIRITQWTYDMYIYAAKGLEVSVDELIEHTLFQYAKDVARAKEERIQVFQDLRDHMEADI